ncbi:hypothetical protein D3C73_1366060 [compost metagenome]
MSGAEQAGEICDSGKGAVYKYRTVPRPEADGRLLVPALAHIEAKLRYLTAGRNLHHGFYFIGT